VVKTARRERMVSDAVLLNIITLNGMDTCGKHKIFDMFDEVQDEYFVQSFSKS
jgi:hypothetical protein